MIWLYILGVLVGYAVWCVGSYILGTWLDDVLSEGIVANVILSSIVATWLPVVVLYLLAVRSFFFQKWLLLGCLSSRDELLVDFG